MIPAQSMRYIYALTIFGSLTGGYLTMKIVETSSKNRTDSYSRQPSLAELELAAQQRAAINEMRKRAKEATWQENLSAAGLATAEFMVPPSVREEEEQEKDWVERSGRK